MGKRWSIMSLKVASMIISMAISVTGCERSEDILLMVNDSTDVLEREENKGDSICGVEEIEKCEPVCVDESSDDYRDDYRDDSLDFDTEIQRENDEICTEIIELEIKGDDTKDIKEKDASELDEMNQEMNPEMNQVVSNDVIRDNGEKDSIVNESGACFVDCYTNQAFELINAYRVQNGLSELIWNSSLSESASVRALEISRQFSHTRLDGSSCFGAIAMSYNSAAENIAEGQWSAEWVVDSWINSSGHRENILSSEYTQTGIACYYDPKCPYEYYWVEIFTN